MAATFSKEVGLLFASSAIALVLLGMRPARTSPVAFNGRRLALRGAVAASLVTAVTFGVFTLDAFYSAEVHGAEFGAGPAARLASAYAGKGILGMRGPRDLARSAVQ